MSIKQRFYVDVMGLHSEVTGSSILCIIKYPSGETKKFLIDCGLFQEPSFAAQNDSFPFNPKELEFVLVTHNHIDHIGRLPLLIKNGFQGNILTTSDTSVLLPYALGDTYRILKNVAKRNYATPLYSEVNVSRTCQLTVGLPFKKPFMVSSGIKVTFFKNGHHPGAALILVQISEYGQTDINLLFTGDYNSKNMFFSVPELPAEVLNLPLIIVQEATYGSSLSTLSSEYSEPNLKVQTAKCYAENVLKALENGSTVVSPVFSLGRSQELMLFLQKLQNANHLSKEFPIYYDGKLGIQYTKLYTTGKLSGITPDMQNFLPENFYFVDSDIRQALLKDPKPKIILTTSGMGSYGPAPTYIAEYITHKNALIHFTGYCAEGTLSRKLFDAADNSFVEINGMLVSKKADIKFTEEFSAHAKADQMIDFLKTFNSPLFVLINHGTEETKKTFAELVLNHVNTKTGILNRNYFYRFNSYGIVKTLPTNFI